MNPLPHVLGLSHSQPLSRPRSSRDRCITTNQHQHIISIQAPGFTWSVGFDTCTTCVPHDSISQSPVTAPKALLALSALLPPEPSHHPAFHGLHTWPFPEGGRVGITRSVALPDWLLRSLTSL